MALLSSWVDEGDPAPLAWHPCSCVSSAHRCAASPRPAEEEEEERIESVTRTRALPPVSHLHGPVLQPPRATRPPWRHGPRLSDPSLWGPGACVFVFRPVGWSLRGHVAGLTVMSGKSPFQARPRGRACTRHPRLGFRAGSAASRDLGRLDGAPALTCLAFIQTKFKTPGRASVSGANRRPS